MLAAVIPSHPFTRLRSFQRPLSKKRFSPDFSYLISQFKAQTYGRAGTCSSDMPSRNQDHSPKPQESSTTPLAVRQASGTSTTDTTRRRPQHHRGGSEFETASSRPHNLLSETAPASATSVNSASGRAVVSLPADKYIDKHLEQRKALLIDIYMEKVEEFLDDTLGPLEEEEANDHDGHSNSSSYSSSSRGVKRAASSGRLNPGYKRQNRGSSNEEVLSDNEGNDERNPTQKQTKTDIDGEKLRFACPFYKRDPQRYKNHQACRGPGWKEMHRLKEHLHRQHRLFTCVRCFENFKKDDLLQNHVRAKEACTVRDETSRMMDPIEGMSLETQRQLKSKTRKPGKKDAQDKLDDARRWYELFHILFGQVAVDELPSPYYDDPASTNGKIGLAGSDALQTQYRRFLRREVPKMVRRELWAQIDIYFKDVGPAMRSRLSMMMQNSADKCAKIFEYIPTAVEAAARGDPGSSSSSSRVNSRAGSPAAAAATAEVGASESGALIENTSIWPNGFLDIELDCGFDTLSSQCEYGSGDYQTYYDPNLNAHDSAYESWSRGGPSASDNWTG